MIQKIVGTTVKFRTKFITNKINVEITLADEQKEFSNQTVKIKSKLIEFISLHGLLRFKKGFRHNQTKRCNPYIP